MSIAYGRTRVLIRWSIHGKVLYGCGKVSVSRRHARYSPPVINVPQSLKAPHAGQEQQTSFPETSSFLAANEIWNHGHGIKSFRRSAYHDVFNNNIRLIQYRKNPNRFLEATKSHYCRLLEVVLQEEGMCLKQRTYLEEFQSWPLRK